MRLRTELSKDVYKRQDAKYAIEDGMVSVNGQTATQRGKKLVDGDIVTYEGKTIKIVK